MIYQEVYKQCMQKIMQRRDVESCVGQKLCTIHSMCIDKQAWIKEELRGSTVSDLDEEEVCNSQESVNSLQESDFLTEESRRKFIKDSFKIDENEILSRDAKLKEEVIKLFLENFSTLALHPNHYGKTDLLELQIELQQGAGTLDKFQRTFFAMSAHEKIHRLVDRCNTCLAKERSIQAKRGPHVPSTMGNVGEKVFVDLVSMSETMRKNCYMLTVQYGFTRFASAYPICNKEVGTVARVLIHEHFSVFGLPTQMHSDNGAKFINKLWAELFSELKILHTRTPPYNPSSNIVEQWHRIIVIILRTMGREMQNKWELGVKAACLAYNTMVHSSTGQTLFFATFGREAIVPIHWVYPIPKPDVKDVSAWTETMQERFQTAYARIRERQQQTVRRNAQYYKPILN